MRFWKSTTNPKKALRRLILWLALWLGTLPIILGTVIGVYYMVANIGSDGKVSPIVVIGIHAAQVVIVVASLWLIVGWLPVVMAGLDLERVRSRK